MTKEEAELVLKHLAVNTSILQEIYQHAVDGFSLALERIDQVEARYGSEA
jgi:hypothetical protein